MFRIWFRLLSGEVYFFDIEAGSASMAKKNVLALVSEGKLWAFQNFDHFLKVKRCRKLL